MKTDAKIDLLQRAALYSRHHQPPPREEVDGDINMDAELSDILEEENIEKSLVGSYSPCKRLEVLIYY
jgi:hypothetical protein